MGANPQIYVDIFTFTNSILSEKVRFLCIDFCKQNRYRTILKKKVTHSLKNYVAFLFTFLEKVIAISKFLTTLCLDVRF